MARVNHIYGNIINEYIILFRDEAKHIDSIRLDIEKATNSFLETWEGKAATEFQYQYEILNQQIKDIEDELFDFYEDLAEGYAGYLEVDNELANSFKNKE